MLNGVLIPISTVNQQILINRFYPSLFETLVE
jgi:hypothetical protein